MFISIVTLFYGQELRQLCKWSGGTLSLSVSWKFNVFNLKTISNDFESNALMSLGGKIELDMNRIRMEMGDPL